MHVARVRRLAEHVAPAAAVPAAATAPEEEARSSDASGPLTDAQIRFFGAFGYVHSRACFSEEEMAEIIREVDAGLAKKAGGRELISRSERLTALLLEDDRSAGVVAQLMASLGEERWLLSGSNYLAGAMKDSGPPKGYKGVHMPEHSFHSDNPGVEECWPRIKCMLCKCSRSLCVFFQA